MFSFTRVRLSSIKRVVLKSTQTENYKNDSLRYASIYQRPRPLPNEQMIAMRTELLETCNGKSTEKWQKIRGSLMSNFKHINNNNIDATILAVCNDAEFLSVAKDYVAFLKNNSIEPNIASLGRLLRIYNMKFQRNGKLSCEEENEIIEICDKIHSNHEILDAVTCEHLIHGLVATQRWRDALKFFEMLKLTAKPSNAAYIQIIAKALSSRAMDLSWILLDEMADDGKIPLCELYIDLLNVIAKDCETFHMNFRKLLKFFEKHQLFLTQKVASHIEEMSRNEKLKLQAKKTQISHIGKCTSCGQHLKSVAISENDFEKLRDSFLQKVLIRRDAFQKSSPEEISNFKQFVDRTAPYDCVIDGLNVAFSKGSKRTTKELADLLVSVVRYFDSQCKSVLVLGRQHMNRWPKNSMTYLRKRAHLYLTNDLTHDDPFMLYATLKSGQSTDFFSRDLMRSHAYLLGPELKAIFRRWQQEHQFSLITQTKNGKLAIKEPIRHLICAHEINGSWHLPLATEYLAYMPEIFELPESWLCLRLET